MQMKMILWGLCFMLFAYRGAQGKFHQRAALMQALATHRAGDLNEAFGDYFDQTESKIATLETKVTKLEAKRKAHCQVGHTYFGKKEDYWGKQEGIGIWHTVYGPGWTKNITQSFSAFKKRPTFVASISSFVRNKESTSDMSLGIRIKVLAVTTSNATIEVDAFDKKMEQVQVTWVACEQ